MDIEGYQTPAGGTLPPNVLVTTLKPDIVIIDKTTKAVTVFELTVPGEQRIEISHKLKYEKYQHMSTDTIHYTVSIVPFEVGSNTGYISSDNKTHIKSLHNFCSKNIKLKKFLQNISAITVLSSYFIFNCRSHSIWEVSDPILPPFNNQ